MLRRLLPLALLLAAAGCGASSPTDLTQRALEQVRSGQYDDAIATGTDAIAAEPGEADNYLYRGRAYHYRNAMGDRKKAIDDFGQAIRLAPDSSDAYYSRALAYRDVGETELADADEEKARQLDGLVQDVYERLPDLTPPAEVAKAAPENETQPAVSGGPPGGDTEDERKTYERLKKRYEPGFGSLRSPRKTEDQKAAEERQEARKERYRAMMEQPTYRLPSQTDPAEETGGVLGGVDLSQTPGDEDPSGATPSESPARGAGGLGAGGVGAGVRPLTPSPEQQPGLAPNTGLRSPFPQRAPAPTGYVEPANPFAPQPRGTAGRSTRVGQPFGAQPTTANPYSNPAVRPPNARDYLP